MTRQFPPVCLTIGVSDSSGGSGVQADIKAIAAQECYAAAVVVGLVAQNFSSTKGSFPIPEAFVHTQLDAVMDELPVKVVKVGMVPSVDTIRVIGRWLREHPKLQVVVDPVAADSRGIPILQPEMVQALCEQLMPRATVTTPNRFEAALLSGMEECLSIEDMQQAASTIFKRFGCPVVVTGGGLTDRTVDVLCGLDGVSHIEAPTHKRAKVHGAGCAHSAVIAACLARGQSLRDAIYHAKHYVSAAISNAPALENGRGTLWHSVKVNAEAINVGSGAYHILPDHA
jgi:hydroxymethylpyrimidine kinase/phosphomethylpyrimidine kinase